MGAGWRGGEAAYGVYRLLTSALSPLFLLHLHGRRLRRLEHPVRWPERFGRPSSPRPPGPLLWFHAVSLGEGMAAIPVIKRCLQELPSFTVLMTTTTVSAFEVIKDKLPNCVIYQFAPIDTPAVMDAFFQYWDPQAVFLIENRNCFIECSYISEIFHTVVYSSSGAFDIIDVVEVLLDCPFEHSGRHTLSVIAGPSIINSLCR